jgi:hypothetical protein
VKFIDGYVRSPLAGIAPWILMAVINGPGRFEEAASVALALALLTLWVGSRRGVPVHLLEAFTVVYFGVLALLGLVAPDSTIEWLALWAGELSNIALAAYVISTAWAGAFLFSALVGAYGDAVLRDNDNFWTAWILPIGAIIFAVSFTEFYPDYATGEKTSIAGAFDWFPPFVTVAGIVGWVSDALPDSLAIALIAVGVVGSALMRKLLPKDAKTTEPQ